MGDRSTRPQLCTYPRLRGNSCSPNSGFAVGLGTSEGRMKCRGPSAGNAPAEGSTSFPARRPHASEPRGRPKDLLGRDRSPRFVPFSLRGVGGSATRPALSGGLASRGSQVPGWARRAPRRCFRGDPALPATRGVCRAGTCLPRPGEHYRPLIFSSSTRVSLFPTVGSDLCLPRRAGPPATVWLPRSQLLGSPARGARDRFTKGSLVSWGHTRTRVRESRRNRTRVEVSGRWKETEVGGGEAGDW